MILLGVWGLAYSYHLLCFWNVIWGGFCTVIGAFIDFLFLYEI